VGGRGIRKKEVQILQDNGETAATQRALERRESYGTFHFSRAEEIEGGAVGQYSSNRRVEKNDVGKDLRSSKRVDGLGEKERKK